MDSSKEEYREFIKKVRRTIYVDNISPRVTKSVMKAAFDQFGNVVRVEFIPTYMQPEGTPRAALVEMENRKQAEQIISGMESCPLMIAGMPRPVRAKPARMEMFDDRPCKPGGQVIYCCWLHPKDPSFETANRIKKLVKEHAAEASFLLKQQLAEEKDLAKQQEEMLKGHHKKLERIEGLFIDGTVQRLAQHYGIDMKKS